MRPRFLILAAIALSAAPALAVSDGDLLGALADTLLTRAPGSQWEYSNFAMMVLSYALARRKSVSRKATSPTTRDWAACEVDPARLTRSPTETPRSRSWPAHTFFHRSPSVSPLACS